MTWPCLPGPSKRVGRYLLPWRCQLTRSRLCYNGSTYEMILYLSQLDSIQVDTGTASCTISFVDHHSFSFLLGKYLRRAAVNQTFWIFLMIEVAWNLNAGHKTIEACWNRRPFSVFLTNTFLRINFNVNFLILSELGNHYVLMDKFYFAKLGGLVTLRNPTKLAWID